jgi:hypothetical protein
MFRGLDMVDYLKPDSCFYTLLRQQRILYRGEQPLGQDTGMIARRYQNFSWAGGVRDPLHKSLYFARKWHNSAKT